MVGDRKAQVAIEYQHAGGKVGQYVFEVGFGRLERDPVGLDDVTCLVELSGHRIERFRENAELVAAGHRRSAREVSPRHGLRRLRQVRERLGQPVGQDDRQGDCEEKAHQQRERERDDIDPLQTLARQGEFAVVAIGRLDCLRAARKRLRKDLPQLEISRFVGKRERIDRYYDTQGERLARRRIDRGVAAIHASLAQRLRARDLRIQLGHVFARSRHYPTIAGDDHRLLNASLFAQPVEKHDLVRLLPVGKLQGHGAPLDVHLGEHLIDRALCKGDPAFERGIHFDVEPGFDALAQKLDRHRVNQQSRRDGHHRQ